tara:strand:+ start:2839 stop:3231 length:393 start_codon:yes stop_codon:yes gene_type:complete
MRAGRELRRIIMDRIMAEVPGLAGRVYDKAAEDTPYPYATLGPSYWNDESTDCFAARSIVVQVDVWHKVTNKGECEDLTDDIATALDGYADTARLTMHPMQVPLVRVTDDPDGQSVHGIVQVESDVESNG